MKTKLFEEIKILLMQSSFLNVDYLCQIVFVT